MEIFESYPLIIHASLIIILSYFFNYIAQKTNIPSVLLLMALGIGMQFEIAYFSNRTINFFPYLELLGIVGLVMIVLEAALDLKLTKSKWKTIWKSFVISLLSIVIQGTILTLLFKYYLNTATINAVLYAMPLAITSSAIVIPSIKKLAPENKEFLIYESTFSDILGIMFFYFIIDYNELDNIINFGVALSWNLALTLIISVFSAYLVIFIFQKMKSEVKLFLLISVLLLLYATGKLFHLSSLMLILIFGIFMRNPKIFFRGFTQKYINIESVNKVFDNLKLITEETSFVVRTFFFLIFGITISLASLLNLKIAIISFSVIAILLIVRFFLLLIFTGRKSIIPNLFIAPRGLISILLFYAIPERYISEEFEHGILFFVILLSSILMAISLFWHNRKEKNRILIKNTFLELDAEIEDEEEIIKILRKDKSN